MLDSTTARGMLDMHMADLTDIHVGTMLPMVATGVITEVALEEASLMVSHLELG